MARVDGETLGRVLENACVHHARVSNATLHHIFEAGGRFDFDEDRFAWALDAWREFVAANAYFIDRIVEALPDSLPLDVSREIAKRSLGAAMMR